jgi:hypothetical protein
LPRSKASIERRKAYSRKWHQENPDYRKKRLADEAAREREREKRRAWRALNVELVRAQKARYSARTRTEVSEFPDLFMGHPLFETARYICGSRPAFDYGLMWEERMGEVVLALLEGRDPAEADRRTANTERQWRYHVVGFYQKADVREDTGQVVYVYVSSEDRSH